MKFFNLALLATAVMGVKLTDTGAGQGSGTDQGSGAGQGAEMPPSGA